MVREQHSRVVLPMVEDEWADPGFVDRRAGRWRNALRFLAQLIRPPEGHRTIPTKTGSMLILVSLGVGSAAFNTGHNILYITLSLLLSSLLLSGVLSWMNFRGCRWRIRTDPRGRVGESHVVAVELRNTKRWMPSFGFVFRVGLLRSGVAERLLMKKPLQPGSMLRLEWLVAPAVRGCETIRLIDLSCRFPFGFLRKSIVESHQAEVVIWPPRVNYRFRAREGFAQGTQGRDQLRRGEGEDILSLRDYRVGDAPRRVDWKASARTRRIVVRETAEETRDRYSLDLQPHPKQWQNEDQFERLCALAGTLAEDLFWQGRLEAVRIGARRFESLRSPSDLYRFLDHLAVLEPVVPDPNPEGSGRSPDPRFIIRFQPDGADGVICALDGKAVGGTL